ncbi:MAG: glutamate--cysteine ligase, partial [Gammaproteobacteria bacterium]|nr:glutamate--cysteine ligase [Gammaproteobacteria bacterium]
MTQHYSLFSVTGVELEYMIVDKTTLDIRPIADKLIFELAGDFTNEVELGRIAVSNELALHVIELKTNGPVDDLPSVIAEFHKVVLDLNERLKSHGACLMPSGAHPWLDPNQGVDLWPHGDRQIYHTF